jgi:dGTPase
MSLLRTREAFEREEAVRLGPFAVRSAESRGRVVAEPQHPYRTDFQRDRDRLVHSRAFRRLEYKTQVFVHHEGDHYRNRLTHTLEAGQISRTIARALRLNEELAEAVVLAHDLGHTPFGDLGHTPFGHAGERALAELMQQEGGFDHNRQSLRIVDLLEERYPGFRGLNLSYETREGICKHGCSWEHPLPLPDPALQPSLEAQAADSADEIAYTNHDLDDGLRAGLLRLEQLEEVPLWEETRRELRGRLGETSERVMHAQTIVALINRLVTDLIESSAARLEASGVSSVNEVRHSGRRMIGLSPELEKLKREFERFLQQNLYHHPRVLEVSERGGRILSELFRAFRAQPKRLPARVRERFPLDGEARAIADYVAGMTDRFAMEQHRRHGGLDERI